MENININSKNQCFLTKVIELYKLVYMNDIMLLIDTNGIVIFISNKSQEVIKSNAEESIGKHYIEALPLPKENINKITESFCAVIKTGSTKEYLSINLNHTNDFMIMQGVIKPIINPETNDIVALSVESRRLNFPVYFYKMLMFTSNALRTNKIEHSDQFLTLREHEIGFLLFYCKNANNIAQIISNLHDKPISSKTINNIIRQQLYAKFNVYNLDTLRDKLYENGYHKNIPASLLANTYIDLSNI